MNNGTTLYDMIENLKKLMQEMNIRYIAIDHEMIIKFNHDTQKSEQRHIYAVRIDQDDDMRSMGLYPRCFRERNKE